MSKQERGIVPFSFPILNSEGRLERLYQKNKITWAVQAIISLHQGAVICPTLWLSQADIHSLIDNYEETKSLLVVQFTEMATDSYNRHMALVDKS